MEISDLPLLNATLNATAAVLLVLGYLQIRRRRRGVHRGLMLAAFAVSALFLASYSVYHASAGSRPFGGHGAVRVIYFAVLSSHVILAALVLPLALVTLGFALRGRFVSHRRIARWTLPIWVYVSVTGVLVYLMLYRL